MILVAPTAFKGTLDAPDVARALGDGVRSALPDARVELLPLSDGGDGLLDALQTGVGGERVSTRACDPLGRSIDAEYLLLDGAAVVETAAACGMRLLRPEELDPLRLHTRGVGELLLSAARSGADRLLVGLGGSATVDGGAGMARALGWSLLDARGRPVPDGGAGLGHLDRIEPPVVPPDLPPVRVLADVRNPLIGPQGAARVFAPQKGADEAAVAALEAGLERLARVIERSIGRDVAALPGAGAAGGLGAACAAFLDAPLDPGARVVLDLLGFGERLSRASLLVTGEGRWDAQSRMGKVVGEAVERARAAGVPVLVLAGSADGAPGDGVVVRDRGGARLDAGGLTALARDAIASGAVAPLRSRQ